MLVSADDNPAMAVTRIVSNNVIDDICSNSNELRPALNHWVCGPEHQF